MIVIAAMLVVMGSHSHALSPTVDHMSFRLDHLVCIDMGEASPQTLLIIFNCG